MTPCCCEGKVCYSTEVTCCCSLEDIAILTIGVQWLLQTLCPMSLGYTNKPRTSHRIYLFQKITFCAWETQRCDLHLSWWFVQSERPTGKEVVESLPCGTPGQIKMYRVMSYWKSLAVPLQSHWLLSSTTPILSPFINLPLQQRVFWLRGFVIYTILFYSFPLRTLIL